MSIIQFSGLADSGRVRLSLLHFDIEENQLYEKKRNKKA
jgi:hypothetical protein